jgi:SprT protein
MDTASTKQAIINRVEELTKIATAKGLHYPSTTHDFGLRGRCGGQYAWGYRTSTASFTKSVLRWNLDIAKENLNDYLTTTVPHELAHAIQRYHFPRSTPHGKEWKQCCRALVGHELPRCHQYETKPARIVKRYNYACACKTHAVSSVVHGRIQRGRNYICTSCKTRIGISNS